MSNSVRRLTTSDNIYQVLKNRIIDGYYQVGVRLKETQISEEFGISTTPVREALSILCTEGYLEKDSFKGMVLKTYSLQDIKDAYWLYGKLHLRYIKRSMDSADNRQWNEIVNFFQKQLEQDDGSHIFMRVIPFMKKLREHSSSKVLENCLHSTQAVLNMGNVVGHTEESAEVLEILFSDLLKGLHLKDYMMVEKQCDQIIESSINSLSSYTKSSTDKVEN